MDARFSSAIKWGSYAFFSGGGGGGGYVWGGGGGWGCFFVGGGGGGGGIIHQMGGHFGALRSFGRWLRCAGSSKQVLLFHTHDEDGQLPTATAAMLQAS